MNQWEKDIRKMIGRASGFSNAAFEIPFPADYWNSMERQLLMRDASDLMLFVDYVARMEDVKKAKKLFSEMSGRAAEAIPDRIRKAVENE